MSSMPRAGLMNLWYTLCEVAPFVMILSTFDPLVTIAMSFATASSIVESAEPMIEHEAIESHSAMWCSRRKAFFPSVSDKLVEYMASSMGQKRFRGLA